METLTVELNNRKTFSTLRELEGLSLLRIVKKQSQANNMADLLSNCISNEQAIIDEQRTKTNARRMGTSFLIDTLVHNLTLLTRNITDFKSIENLNVVNSHECEF